MICIYIYIYQHITLYICHTYIYTYIYIYIYIYIMYICHAVHGRLPDGVVGLAAQTRTTRDRGVFLYCICTYIYIYT